MSSQVQYILGSGIRLNLLSRLVKRPLTPTQLALMEKKHVSHVSRALAELRTKGLVEYQHVGPKQRLYRPTDRGLVLYTRILMMSR